MKNKTSKKAIAISIVVLSMYLNIEYVVSIFLANMANDFPNSSLVSIQQVYSIIFLVEFFTQFTIPWFSKKLSKRKIIIYFQGFTVIGGLIAFFFGKSIALLYISSVVIGFAAAIVSTISKSIIFEHFQGDDIPKMLAVQQVAQAIGTIMLQLLAGRLASIAWKYGYLTFLFGLVSLFAGIFMLPEDTPEVSKTTEEGKKIKFWTRDLIHDVLITGLFGVIFCTYNYNLSFLVQEKNLGNATITGSFASILTAAAFVAALIFPTYSKICKDRMLVYAFLMLLCGYIIICMAPNAWIIVLGIIFVGLGQGLFSPAVYVNVAKHSKASSSSVAMVNAGASAGMYLYPYLITYPSQLFGTTAVTRFVFASVLFVPVILYEIIYSSRKTKE